MQVAIAQIAPVWLDRAATTAKVIDYIERAAEAGAQLVTFGETLLPGYPFWLTLTHGANFNDDLQKDLHTHYLREAVQIERGDLDEVCDTARRHSIAVYLGIAERAADRGGHSIYCSLVYIDHKGVIQSVHRKLQPTYEERLAWAPGDGHGLRTHELSGFTLGGLNCWENWIPMARQALYAQGENVRVAVWPGAERITRDITRFVAMEGRSYVVSASSLMRVSDIPEGFPHRAEVVASAPDLIADGGSCIAAPDGSWLVPPQVGEEQLIIATLDLDRVYRERQNFDPAGHYSRPDILRLHVDRERQGTVRFPEGKA